MIIRINNLDFICLLILIIINNLLKWKLNINENIFLFTYIILFGNRDSIKFCNFKLINLI